MPISTLSNLWSAPGDDVCVLTKHMWIIDKVLDAALYDRDREKWPLARCLKLLYYSEKFHLPSPHFPLLPKLVYKCRVFAYGAHHHDRELVVFCIMQWNFAFPSCWFTSNMRLQFLYLLNRAWRTWMTLLQVTTC